MKMALSFHEKPTILIIVMLFLSVGIAIVSLSINASAEQYSIPSWIKDTAKLWGDDKIGDSNFKQGLQWLIENKIMTIPEGKAYSGSNNQQIPIWVRNDAKWWADDQIGDSDFVQGMQYLIQIRTINIPTPTVNNPTPLPDTTPPVITLLGSNPVTVQVGSTYTDAGATATDNVDGILTPSITESNSVNTTVAGTYTVTYNVSDKAGNAATQVTRTVNVVNNTPLDTTPPVITLLGSNPVTVQVGSTYTDAGATATDNIDGILTPSITVSNSVNTTVAGTYTVTYNVSDKAGNAATQVTRTVNVVNNTPLDTTPPVITLLGSNPVTVQVGSTYTDAGATATDNIDGILTPSITVSNSVNTTVAGTYTVTYNVSDKAGNAATQVTRTVNVVNNTPLDTTPPVITLLGSNPVTVQVGSTYTDAGATATDNVDGVLTSKIVTVNPVNTGVVGTYTVTYNVKDASGNASTQVTRIVNVVNPNPTPTNGGFDKWGIKMLHPTITNGREWFNTWDNSHSRILTANDRDPDDSMFKVSGQRDSMVVIDGKGVATMSGTQPRMYVYDQTLALKWLNVEVTVYGERISETQLYSSQGINIGARSTHQNEVNTPCGVNTYYSRMLYSGNANFAKELNWPDDVKKPGSINGIDWNLFGNTTFPYDTWIGHKFVLRTVDSGTHVRMEMWRDLTNGLNGGDWKSILNYTDTGDMTDPITPGCPTNDLSHIILEAGPSIFIRNTDISAAQYKEFSVREIDPLP